MYQKEDFLKIFDEKIRRDGAQGLRQYLVRSDFFEAPASTRYHGACVGGLCDHSVNVYRRFVERVQAEMQRGHLENVSEETVAICGLLHDVCKIHFYKSDYRNVKEDGVWVRKPCFVREEAYPFGHGEKSVFLIARYITLLPAEAMAINWHMGGFDSRVKGGDLSISEAYAMYPLAVLLHVYLMAGSMKMYFMRVLILLDSPM